MFADSLIESSWAYRGRRSLTTLTSFGLQAVTIGMLLLIPLWTTVGLPIARTVSTPVGIFRRDPGPAPHTKTGRTAPILFAPFNARIVAPGRIPDTIAKGDANSQPVAPDLDGGIYIDHNSDLGPGIALPTVGTRPVIPIPPPSIKREFKTSSMLEGSLIRRVQPAYPPLARSARIQGSVILAAIISKDGTMQNLKLISGHPMLVLAAVQAVSQWRYRPYILNGEAIEVETQITVNFVLGAN